MVRYSLLRVEDYDGTEDLPVQCLVLAALEYAPGEPVPRSILALRSPMALTGDGSAFEGQVFAALYSGRNFTCIVSGNGLPEGTELCWGSTAGPILPGGSGSGLHYQPGALDAFPDWEQSGQTPYLPSVSYSAQATLFFPALEA